ncbi:bifunctional tetrahydrofolate synthase/dihydrofolate synthase [Paraferrimonas sp. SM1919]|uniref:bifunctional tetrahydrofolate synthase/dihydrofolate synthase n=1 Tax=Paraferrimonas sp. SM1919 TaxID=2662263 RepID=UPI0013D2AAF2|nr:bifunctional tetrahydrofolate synthase/dihydrofolate synthase [Paraferrimonas sp. SM1919]
MTPKAPLTSQSMSDWLDHLLSLHNIEVDLGLERITDIAQEMGLTHFENTKVVTVAGTNGKGSTCAMVEQLCLAKGHSVAVYSSPHFEHYRERLRINGEELYDAQHISAFITVEKARADRALSFFEFATLAALELVRQQQPDVLILEVGLGGRLDATNIVQSDCAAITSIGLDHVEYLGDTREKVGYEKAGIARANKPLIIGEPECPQTVIDYADDIGAKLYLVGHDFNYVEQSSHWAFEFEHQHWSQLPLPKLPLANAATALAICHFLIPNLQLEHAKQGLEVAKLAGRMEYLSKQPSVLLDVAHNPHAAAYLKQQLPKVSGRTYGICGMLKDKDYQQVLSLLNDHIDSWHLVSLQTHRSATAEQLQQALCAQHSGDLDTHIYQDVASAWERLKPQLCQDDMVLIFGSFYTVAEFKAHFLRE